MEKDRLAAHWVANGAGNSPLDAEKLCLARKLKRSLSERDVISVILSRYLQISFLVIDYSSKIL